MTAVNELRARYKDAFHEHHGIKLGFMSFFVKAAVDALQTVPAVNARIDGTDIVYRKYQDIGIAVGGGRGLLVPVLRNAESMSLAAIELAVADFATRALQNKIGLAELQGGTFTITNGGIYGSLLSTPIVNPPQSGILGMHAIQDRPVAIDRQVVRAAHDVRGADLRSPHRGRPGSGHVPAPHQEPRGVSGTALAAVVRAAAGPGRGLDTGGAPGGTYRSVR